MAFHITGRVVRVPRVEGSGVAGAERIGGDRDGKKFLSVCNRARVPQGFPVSSVRAGVEQVRGWGVNPDALLFHFVGLGTAPDALRCCAGLGVSSGSAQRLGAGSSYEQSRHTYWCSKCCPDRSGGR
jgi:hypothetical protein